MELWVTFTSFILLYNLKFSWINITFQSEKHYVKKSYGIYNLLNQDLNNDLSKDIVLLPKENYFKYMNFWNFQI